MKNKHLLPKPESKYNDWWEKKDLPQATPEIMINAHFEAKRMGLVRSEKEAYESHVLMNTNGFEFDVISNAHIQTPIQFDNKLILSPRFLGDDQLDGAPLGDEDVYNTMQMMANGKFEYEGWIPITTWDRDSIRKAIRTIDETLSGITLIGSSHFTWTPRYLSKDATFTTPFTVSDQQKLQNLLTIISKFPDEDQKAIHKSLGWFSNAYRQTEPIVKFLFFMLAMESIIKYIEEKAPEYSMLIKFRTNKLTKSERREKRNECINEKMKDLDPNLGKIISEAYFECVVGIKKTLKNHFLNLYDENGESIKILFEEDEYGNSLYDVRSSIAHGGVDSLSQDERELIDDKSWPLERVIRGYMCNLLTDKFPKK